MAAVDRGLFVPPGQISEHERTASRPMDMNIYRQVTDRPLIDHRQKHIQTIAERALVARGGLSWRASEMSTYGDLQGDSDTAPRGKRWVLCRLLTNYLHPQPTQGSCYHVGQKHTRTFDTHICRAVFPTGCED